MISITPDFIDSLDPNQIFVFGSNLAGAHGGGAARLAHQRFGAVMGVGVGLQGQSYAIPTMQGGVDTIRPYVDQFIEFARSHPHLHFLVTRIGCGIAGFRPEQIAPLFAEATKLSNVSLPDDFISNIPEATEAVVGWDADEFIAKYQKCKASGDYNKIKLLRAEEYQNTIKIVNQGFYINNHDECVEIDDYFYRGVAVMYRYEMSDAMIPPKVGYKTEIKVVNADCLDVAMHLKLQGHNVAVLNMASRKNPGGGVINGAGAQEESLFRRTDLFLSMYQFAEYASMYGLKPSTEQYPLDPNFGGVYTPESLVFRESEALGFALMDKPVALSFIAVAAINRPELIDEHTIHPSRVEQTKNKIRTILRIGTRHRHDTLVLGAFGCGAFRNPPRHMARLFHEVLDEEEMRGRFRLIVFAILDDHNASIHAGGNYKPFFNEFF